MAAYTPLTWVDEVLADDERFDIKTDGGTPIDSTVQIVLATAVAVAGTPVAATNMNHIEQGIVDAQTFVPVSHRQGDTGAWGDNYGTTNFDTSAVHTIIQVGCADVTASGDFELTFPVPFSAAPIVIATAGSGSSLGVFIATSYITATGCHLSAWQASTVRANSVYTGWMAIGPA